MKVKLLNSIKKNTPAVKAYNKAVLAGRKAKPLDATLLVATVDLQKIKEVAKLQKSLFAKARKNSKTNTKKTSHSKKLTSK